MNNILKYFSFLFTLTLIIGCGGGGGEEGGGDTGGGDVTVNPPAKSTLSAPANNKTCETGTSVSSTQSDVDFTWGVSADTDSYDLKITDLNSSVATNKTGLTTTSTKVTLDKGVPYSWVVTSKSTKSSVTTPSDTWKFYLAGTGVANYAPFPADLKAPSSGSTVKRTDGKVTFTWEGSDPDSGDTLTYTLYVDTTDGKQTPASAQTDLSVLTLDVALDAATTYYWRVKSSSDGTNSSYSTVYTFITE